MYEVWSCMYALCIQHVRMVDFLQTYNTTPLALACLIGEVPAVHILLDKGADPSGFPASEVHVYYVYAHTSIRFY